MALTAEALQAAIGGDADTALRLLGVSAALCERLAPGAPAPVLEEAIIRCAGWLRGSPASGLYESEVGERGFRLSRGLNPSAMRSSGAAALLLPWRRHSALSTNDEPEEGIMPLELLAATDTEGRPFHVLYPRRVGLLTSVGVDPPVYVRLETRLRGDDAARWVPASDESPFNSDGLRFVDLVAGLYYRLRALDGPGASVSAVDGAGITVG